MPAKLKRKVSVGVNVRFFFSVCCFSAAQRLPLLSWVNSPHVQLRDENRTASSLSASSLSCWFNYTSVQPLRLFSLLSCLFNLIRESADAVCPAHVKIISKYALKKRVSPFLPGVHNKKTWCVCQLSDSSPSDNNVLAQTSVGNCSCSLQAAGIVRHQPLRLYHECGFKKRVHSNHMQIKINTTASPGPNFFLPWQQIYTFIIEGAKHLTNHNHM